MRNGISLFLAGLVLLLSVGCAPTASRQRFVVDFKPDSALRYKFVSERNSSVDLGGSAAAKSGKSKPMTIDEKLELVISYKGIDIDLYGLSTIEAVCESAKVTRTSMGKKKSLPDAVEGLKGKTFRFQISPVGKIVDYTPLKKVLTDLGENAFAKNTGKRGRIKNPDMILDFAAMQWFMWDSVSSIKKPTEGKAIGQSWKSFQFVPMPIPIPVARDTTFTLSEVTETAQGPIAVITESYILSGPETIDWPKPYDGKFQMKGTLGILRGFRPLSLTGTGRQTFDMNTGVVQSRSQQYQIEVEARFMLPLGDTAPKLIIDQKMSIELLEN